jgi:hypothetical protein
VAFDQSGPRWLGISDLIAEPEGPLISLAYSDRSRRGFWYRRVGLKSTAAFFTGGPQVAHDWAQIGGLNAEGLPATLRERRARGWSKRQGAAAKDWLSSLDEDVWRPYTGIVELVVLEIGKLYVA